MESETKIVKILKQRMSSKENSLDHGVVIQSLTLKVTLSCPLDWLLNPLSQSPPQSPLPSPLLFFSENQPRLGSKLNKQW